VAESCTLIYIEAQEIAAAKIGQKKIKELLKAN
jgi:hypothetical protein